MTASEWFRIACLRVAGPSTSAPSYIFVFVSIETPGDRTRVPLSAIEAVLSRVRQAPVTSKFSRANPIGSIIWWHELHDGFARCASIRSRTVRDLPPLVADVSSSFGTTGGGGGGGVPNRTTITHLPRCTGDVRSATEVSVRIAPLPNSPRRLSSVNSTRRN